MLNSSIIGINFMGVFATQYAMHHQSMGKALFNLTDNFGTLPAAKQSSRFVLCYNPITNRISCIIGHDTCMWWGG